MICGLIRLNRLPLSNINLVIGRSFNPTVAAYSNMSRAKVFVTRIDIPLDGIELLKQRCDLEVWSEACPVPREELIRSIRGKDGLLCLLTDNIDSEVLNSAGPSLKVISTMSVGYDHINVEEIKARGIKLGYTPGVLTDATAELTVALLLATSRRLFEGHKAIVKGTWGSWSPEWMCGPGLNDSTVGIVGFGRIGQAVAKRLKGFNIKNLLYYSRTEKKEAAALDACHRSLNEVVSLSDFVVVTCALTPETKGMFSDDLFAKMKPTAVFINTSRGAVVDQDALYRALTNGTIWAAGLDVMTPEPLPADHPLLHLNNCVIIPHLGSATIQTRREMSKLAACNILAALDGKEMPAEVP